MKASPRYLYSNEFHNIFGVFLVDYWDKMFGFNSLKFDDEVLKSGSRSIKAYVTKKYGKRAFFIIHELISFMPLLERLDPGGSRRLESAEAKK